MESRSLEMRKSERLVFMWISESSRVMVTLKTRKMTELGSKFFDKSTKSLKGAYDVPIP